MTGWLRLTPKLVDQLASALLAACYAVIEHVADISLSVGRGGICSGAGEQPHDSCLNRQKRSACENIREESHGYFAPVSDRQPPCLNYLIAEFGYLFMNQPISGIGKVALEVFL